jgi:hypothetical protein
MLRRHNDVRRGRISTEGRTKNARFADERHFAARRRLKRKTPGKIPGVSLSLEISQNIPSKTAPKNTNVTQIARALKLRADSKACLPCN